MTKTVVVFFAVVMLCSIAVRAQSGLSRLGGTVIDATGAIVQGAKVIATNEATRVEVTQVTTSNGSFAFASLPAGHYTITVEQTGFKRVVKTSKVLEIHTPLSVDIVMQAASVADTLTA